jgi:acetyl esterase
MPSNQQNGGGPFLVSNDDLRWSMRHYLGDGWSRVSDPEALPIHASREQLQGLPPAFIITAGLDPLRDTGQQYAEALQSAGVEAESVSYEGVTHGFFGLGAVVNEAKQAQGEAGRALRLAFADVPAEGGSGPQP